MIPSISNIAWRPNERFGAYALMAQAEVKGLEIAPSLFFHGASDPFVPDDAEARRAIGEIETAGLKLVSMQSLLFGVRGAALFEGADARALLKGALHKAINLAGRFGVPNLVFGSPLQRRIPINMPKEKALDEAADFFRNLGDHAALSGTVIVMEANPPAYGTNFLNNFQEVSDFTQRVAHPQVALILDLGAMYMNGHFDLTAEIHKTGVQRLNHVHLSEPHLAPAPANPLQAEAAINVLRALGYRKAVSVEMKPSDDGLATLGDKLAILRDIVKSGCSR